MKRHLLFSALLIAVILCSCSKNDSQKVLITNDNLSFAGTFEVTNSEDLSGTVILSISSGHYECFTNLPFGHGAGRLEVNATTMNFIDTLFFPMPALYGPTCVLSGELPYEFDGDHLIIRNEKSEGSIKYNLKLATKN